ncbi:MAG: sigma-70 family RNA polymerase sigma factor [Synergistaceae bacterium]|nr:sigma-70 family RNA polymerase sigma factor [Synergistaceae bacterium]
MSLTSEHESELWQLCSQGDLDAREELIIEYRPLVLWIAGKMHIYDYELRQDIIQEGMLALIKAVDKFQPERELKFSTYAYHKIHGQMINLLERSEKRAPTPVPDEWLQVAEDSSDSTDEDWLNASEAISRLEGREAEIVQALFFEGKKPGDVAAEKKCNVSHVYRLRRSAIARIRGWLGLEGV